MLQENKKKFELVILKWAYVPAVLIPKNALVFTHVPKNAEIEIGKIMWKNKFYVEIISKIVWKNKFHLEIEKSDGTSFPDTLAS